MNNKGFAITGIIYSILILFLVIITLMLFNLQNRKTILDELKADAVDAVESDNNYDYLLNEVNTLKTKIGTTDISNLGDGTITGNVYELNNGLKWKYHGAIVGGSGVYTLELPNEYKEIMIRMCSGTGGYESNTVTIPKSNEGITFRKVRFGYYLSSASVIGMDLEIENNILKWVGLYSSGNALILANTTYILEVYYR